MTQSKVPPHSLEAEQAVLGGLMLENESWYEVSQRLSEKDFYREDHQLLFSALAELANENKPRDLLTVTECLRARSKLDAAGGVAYVGTLANETPSAANIAFYADIVRERSVLRELISTGTRIVELAFAPDGRSGAELLDSAEQLVFEIGERQHRRGKDFAVLGDLLARSLEQIDQRMHSDGIAGLSTGLDDFDKMTTGLNRGDLIIVAGRPAMGKTSLVMNIAEHVAIYQKKAVAVFSLEMPGEQLATRLIASHGRVDQGLLRSGNLKDQDWNKIVSAVSTMENAQLFVDDTGGLSPNELRTRARRLKRDKDIELVIVDYLQLMQVPGSKDNRTNEIAEISRGMKALAKELEIPVIALSQLNRGVEQRDNKRPRMSDLRESGGIEQDADLIVFIYRDEVYNEDSPDKGIAELIIAKQRNGPIGHCRAAFIGQYTRFENLAFDDGYDGGAWEE